MEPVPTLWRPMNMWRPLRVSALVAICTLFASCSNGSESVSSSGDDECVSHYDLVASADTLAGLNRSMLTNDRWGRVASLRIQAVGDAARNGQSKEKVLRVVDLLDGKDRRLIQVDVWRADDAGLRAGVWLQCTG